MLIADLLPEYLDSKVITDWIGKQVVLDICDLDHCFLVMTTDANYKRKIFRFFTVAGKTVCSVDFKEDQRIPDETLFDLFVKRSK